MCKQIFMYNNQVVETRTPFFYNQFLCYGLLSIK